MSSIAPSEIIDQLEQRQESLIEELDALNHRLETALASLIKPVEDTALTEASDPLSIADDRDDRSC